MESVSLLAVMATGSKHPHPLESKEELYASKFNEYLFRICT